MDDVFRILYIGDDTDIALKTAEDEGPVGDRIALVHEPTVEGGLDRIEDDRTAPDWIVCGNDVLEEGPSDFLGTLRESHPDVPVLLWAGSEADIRGGSIIDDEMDRRPVVDISHREDLRRKYGLVAEASTDAFWDWDPQTDEISRSEGYLSQFGYDHSDHGNDTDWWRDRIHPDDRERVLAALQEAVANPEVQYDETYRFQKADGTYGFVRSRGTVVYDEEGEPRRMVGAHVDLTEREERERSITELHSATRAMIQAESKQAVADLAVETARDVVGLPLTSIQLYDDDAHLLRPVAFTDGVAELFGDVPTIEPDEGIIWRAFSTGEVEVHDDVREDPDTMNPDTVIRSQVILPLGDHGVLVCNSTEIEDFEPSNVTLARLLAENTRVAMNRLDQEEALRRRTRQLEQQNEQLQRFARIISHDLTNPLNVAQGRLEMARGDCDSPHLDKIADAQTRMGEIIERTLTLARQGQAVAERVPVDLARIAERCWNGVATAEATLTVADSITLQGDPERLKHVFENLFRNAVEHGGETATVRVGALDDGFFVADDGPGIPEDDRLTIFDPGESTNEGGTGFGLAIVKEIVEAHGWEVRVSESESGGARFEVTGAQIIDE